MIQYDVFHRTRTFEKAPPVPRWWALQNADARESTLDKSPDAATVKLISLLANKIKAEKYMTNGKVRDNPR